ncbi:putative late blight resistance protein-like protein R1A-4 [Forsythia ovata]|uniref:Late blight resistance protein-like protein R1A-4 n=1 Tax=Forsythia ovata TaxID=205694 RepID=A0ABD1W7W9_9LAMI
MEYKEDIRSFYTDLIVSMKKQIEALEEKVIFVRNFLSWLVDQRDSKDGILNEKMTGLLTYIESVISSAVYFSYFCFVYKVDKNARLKCNISYVVWMIKHIEPEVKEIYVGFLKDSKSSQPDSLPVNLLIVVSIDSLLDNLIQLLKSESTFMVHLKDKIATFDQGLRFLRALLMDPSPRKHDNHEEVDGLLTNIEALISDAV